METTFKKGPNGVVINTNRNGLLQARQLKKVKAQETESLTKRIISLEDKLDMIINLLNKKV